jgi:hypothetical protein
MEPGVRGLAAGPRDPGPGAGDRLRPGLPHGEVRGYHRTPRPSSRSVASTGCASGFELRGGNATPLPVPLPEPGSVNFRLGGKEYTMHCTHTHYTHLAGPF